jgi:streptogramin lyase
MYRRRLTTVAPLVLILASLAMNAGTASSSPAPVFTAYTHTHIQVPRGLAAQGKYVWITDVNEDGRAAHIFRIDASTGKEKIITNKLVTLPSEIVATRRYAWVMNLKLSTWSLLRVNATTLAVQRIKIPSAAVIGVAYIGGPIVLADGYLWIPGSQGILRVNTTTLKVSAITTPLIGATNGVASGSQFLWLNASLPGNDSGAPLTYFVRVSLATGMVAKVNFPGVRGGVPIGDDGTNLWVANSQGIERVNPTSGRFTIVQVPESAQITSTATASSAIANGGIYFQAGLPSLHQTGVVRVGFASGLATVLSSPLLYSPSIIASADGVVWVVNAATSSTLKDPSRWPTLVRVSWPSPS